MNYYNEFDPHAAAWLRELIKEGHIPDGWVDERSITDVRPHEVARFTQQHFFAGIGGWSLALRLAGWPDDKPVRTGSCPCQPFSQAGKGLGEKDARHLWPVFRDLITFGEPTVTFGEQVASKAGRDWLAGIRTDLEGLGYEVGAADLCGAGCGAPHIRQRLYWVANAPGQRRSGKRLLLRKEEAGRISRQVPEASRCRNSSGMAYADGGHSSAEREQRGRQQRQQPEDSSACGLGDTIDQGSQGHGRPIDQPIQEGWQGAQRHCSSPGFWSDFDILGCTDGKSRRIEPGSFPLAHGIPARMVRLRGYGNAIVPQVAAEFIKAFLETQ